MAKIGLAISGGGCKGAFGVGAVTHLMADRGVRFDIVTGTSTGSLIGPLVIANRLDVLRDMYTSVLTPDVITTQPLLDALAGQSSVFKTEPLQSLITKFFTTDVWNDIQASGKMLVLATVDLNSGDTVYFYTGPRDLSDPNAIRLTSREHLIKAALASSNQPAFMPPIKVNNDRDHVYVDGGVREYIPMTVAVKNGAEELYVISHSPDGTSFWAPEKTRSILSILFRTLDLFQTENTKNETEGIDLLTKSHNHIASLRTLIDQAKQNLKTQRQLTDEQINQAFPRIPDLPFTLFPVKLHPIIRPTRDLLEEFHVDNDLIFKQGPMAAMMEKGEARANEVLQGESAQIMFA